VVAAVCAGLFALYLCQSRTAPFNSDGAANVLQGRAIIGGNPLLRGWWTSDVSFYTTELPEYALVTALRGVSPDVVHWCGALSYTLTVLLAALVARGGPSSPGVRSPSSPAPRAGWSRAALAAAIMLTPSILGGTEVFLENPDHAGTAVPVLALLLLLDRAGGRRWLPWAAVALLALAQVGDELALAAATVPLAVVSAARLAAAGRRGQDRAAGERRRDGTLLAAAAASAAAAYLAGLGLRALGAFDLRPLGGVALAPLGALPGHARQLGQTLLLLFGANQPGTPNQAQTISAHSILVAMAGLHLAGLLLAGAGLAAGAAAVCARRADRVTAVLVTSIVVVVAASLGTTLLRSLSNAHEVAVLLPLGAALAGRSLSLVRRQDRASASQQASVSQGAAASRGASAGHRASAGDRVTAGRRSLVGARRRPGAAALLLGGWLAVSLAELGYAAAWPASPPAQQAVAGWLTRHHLRAGLAGYWQASATTVASGDQVLVAPVVLSGPVPAGSASSGSASLSSASSGSAQASSAQVSPAQADRWESSSGWYQPDQHRATFVIAVDGPAAGPGLRPAQVRVRFGAPVAEHRIGPDVILLYDYNLLTRLSGTSFPGGPS
jgi:hypothetical protein